MKIKISFPTIAMMGEVCIVNDLTLYTEHL